MIKPTGSLEVDQAYKESVRQAEVDQAMYCEWKLQVCEWKLQAWHQEEIPFHRLLFIVSIEITSRFYGCSWATRLPSRLQRLWTSLSRRLSIKNIDLMILLLTLMSLSLHTSADFDWRLAMQLSSIESRHHMDITVRSVRIRLWPAGLPSS